MGGRVLLCSHQRLIGREGHRKGRAELVKEGTGGSKVSYWGREILKKGQKEVVICILMCQILTQIKHSFIFTNVLYYQ